MSEAVRIADLLHATFDGEPWHGPCLREVLHGITAAQAASKPVAGAHSVWEILLHLTAWHVITRRRLAGEEFEVTRSMDWPPVPDVSERAWLHTLHAVLDRARSLEEAIRALPDERLHAPIVVPPGTPSFCAQFHGVLQHDAWHIGQISLLRRALGVDDRSISASSF